MTITVQMWHIKRQSGVLTLVRLSIPLILNADSLCTGVDGEMTRVGDVVGKEDGAKTAVQRHHGHRLQHVVAHVEVTPDPIHRHPADDVNARRNNLKRRRRHKPGDGQPLGSVPRLKYCSINKCFFSLYREAKFT